jgi:hypothetical protein
MDSSVIVAHMLRKENKDVVIVMRSSSSVATRVKEQQNNFHITFRQNAVAARHI